MAILLILALIATLAFTWAGLRWVRHAWKAAALERHSASDDRDSGLEKFNTSSLSFQESADFLSEGPPAWEEPAAVWSPHAEPDAALPAPGPARDELIWAEMETSRQSGADREARPAVGGVTGGQACENLSASSQWSFADVSVFQESSPLDAVDGLPIPGFEPLFRCSCGLAYRRDSVLWMKTHLEGRCAGCGDRHLAAQVG